MPRLHALSAVTFATDELRDLSARIAPPYDVLDEGPKRALLEKDEHNIVAVDLPVTPPKTVGPDAAYDQAGETFRGWLNDGVLARQDTPAVFAYEQEYTVAGKTLRRRGLFATLELEEFNQPNGIFRHEMTLQGGIDDRYKLTAATRAQLSPIFGIFADPRKQIAELLDAHFRGGEPDFHGTTANDHVEHRVWRVTDADTIAALQRHFADTEVFIADGHHRYTTALQFSRDHPELPGANRCLFVLVAAEDEGMIVLPTHRVICGLQDFDMDRMLRRIIERDHDAGVFETTRSADQLHELEADLPGAGHHGMGLYDPATGGTYLLSTGHADPLSDALPHRAAVWRELDVAVLHELVIERVLRPDFGGDAITFKYTADLDEMKRLADAEDPGGGRLGVILQPTPLRCVMAVSLAGEVMPPKSTFFYPKLATGLVMHPLDG